MDILRELAKTIAKMFAADLWLSLTAVAMVAACGFALAAHVLPVGVAPWVLGAGVLGALALGVARGARPKA